ncbi:ABC transporter substrate-binding protein [Segnochrobactrum spirostomi]|uniref:Sugar ABC transporter substrate-binding protein n=1 Tax=Segnochrobactrum spirostomi TaxID=2608987 RepID=A0A6A7Y7T7_9HYPH|nr:sugar ABC transporter substrate-binding protein [Segnochrobactrum spirostomi]MQT14121.1 sugar ABC transporter substrate-binding protein [Segnochrobactrum spirostomi]
MTTFKSKSLFAAAGLLAGVALTAFGGVAEAGTVRVTVAEYSSGTGPYFQEAAKAFEAANPGTKIAIEVVPWDNLQQKLTTDISAGANPDLSIIGTRWLLDFVSQGIVAPLDPYVTPAFKDRFIPTFLTPSIMNGKVYGLPIAASARALYYNKDVFKKAGYDEAPKTWADFKTAAEKIKATGDGVYGFGLQGKEIETDVYFYYGLWSYGGNIVQDGKSGIDSPAAIDAAKLYKSFIDEGLTEPGVTSYNREDVQNLFKQGKVATVITAPFLSGQIAKEAPKLNYGVAPIPAGPNGDQGTYGVTDSIVMFENSKVKDEAWKFLDFLFTTEQRTKFDKIEGFLPVNAEEAKNPMFADNPDLKVFASLLPKAHFAPVIPGWEDIAQTTSNAIQKIYLGQGEIEPTLKDAAAKINETLSMK